MAAIEFILFWAPVAFGFVVAASYIGTKLALRSYFDDEDLGLSDMFGIEENNRDR